MSPPFHYAQVENGSVEGCSSGVRHVVVAAYYAVFFYVNPFLYMLINGDIAA